MKVIRWIDRNLWSVPALAFLLAIIGFGAWAGAAGRPVLLAAAPLGARQAIYTSLTGSSSALLGLAIAAVAIITAFSPRPSGADGSTRHERILARARTIISGALLAASFFLLVLLVTATISVPVDCHRAGNGVLTTLVEAAGIASVTGLIIGGVGLALVIVERSHAS